MQLYGKFVVEHDFEQISVITHKIVSLDYATQMFQNLIISISILSPIFNSPSTISLYRHVHYQYF